MDKQSEQLCKLGLAVIETEASAIHALTHRIDSHFANACEYILACKGRIVVTGMGKSGHIANKIAATLASTGTPAFFVHPGEANHGDMGMITRDDVIIAISNSGHTHEILTLLPVIKRLAVPLISLTGNNQSPLAENANVNLDVSVNEEACPLGLAPTTSTTAALVMGDALAIALLQARGFTAEDFALAHPGGSLGRRLLLRVSDLMHKDNDLPKVNPHTSVRDALLEITAKKLGMTTIVNEQNQLVGIFTDGDLRRALDKELNIHHTLISDVMTSHCKTINPHYLAIEALNLMEKFKITSLVIVNEQKEPLGVIHMHDLLQAGVV